MIGRQRLLLSRRDLNDVFASFGRPLDGQQLDSIVDRFNGYAEQLLAHLGAQEVHSFDKSGYENATHLHDMNLELPASSKEQYSVVLDAGSLEHVFNFPVAIRNCMDMVSLGGHYLAIAPANNFFGHGFYQFSPELYCSVFTPANGFELRSLIAFEDRPNATWYTVKNPLEAGGRVTLSNGAPVYLVVVARKLTHAPVFETTPQQSDYLAEWARSTHGDQSPRLAKRPLARLRRRIPEPWKRSLRRVLRGSFAPPFFQPMDPTA